MPHGIGTSSAVWLHAPCCSATAATPCRRRAARRRRRRRPGCGPAGPAARRRRVPRMPTEPSAVVTVTPRVARRASSAPNSCGLGAAAEQHVHGAAALAQPLGQREQRRARAALADQHAGDRLLGQRERAGPAARRRRAGCRPGPRRATQAASAPCVGDREDALDGAAVGTGGRGPGARAGRGAARPLRQRAADGDRDERAGTEPLGDARGDQRQVRGRRRPA